MRFKTGTTLVEFLRDAASDASSILAASTSRPEPGADLSARFEFWRPSHRLQAGPRLAGFRPTIPDQSLHTWCNRSRHGNRNNAAISPDRSDDRVRSAPRFIDLKFQETLTARQVSARRHGWLRWWGRDVGRCRELAYDDVVAGFNHQTTGIDGFQGVPSGGRRTKESHVKAPIWRRRR